MKISVIIPSYNRAHTLARALDSVLAQRYAAQQIIVVDDASVDDTSALLNAYSTVDRVCHSRNKGVSAARNTGLAQAQHPWIAFLDSDDAWLPDKLLRQHQAWLREPDMCLFHTDEIWIRNGRRVNAMNKHAKPDGRVYQASLALCCVSPSSVLLHRSVLDSVGLFDENLPACEDYDLWLRLFNRYPIRLVDQALLEKYGGHADQLSHKYWGMDRFRILSLMKMLDSGLLDEQDTEATRAMLLKKCRVMINGAGKREKWHRVEKYSEIAAEYAAP